MVYSWSTKSGNIVSGKTTSTPLVNGGGVYTLLLTNPTNGCTALDSVLVYQDPDLPVASIDDADTLTCVVSDISLLANIQASNPNVTYVWSTMNGSILSGETTLTPTVNGPGTYIFTLTDPATGCVTSDEVIVAENVFIPDVVILSPDTLTCLVLQIDLTAEPVNYAGTLVYSWSTSMGTILGSSTSNPVVASSSGTYTVEWTVPENGCTNSTNQVVVESITVPTADAGVDSGLPCDGSDLQLDGTASFGQGPLTYSWSTVNGVILSGGTSALPLIGQAGTYLLMIVDGSNGCVNADTVVITSSGTGTAAFNLIPPVCGTPGQFSLLPTGGVPPVVMTIQGVTGSFSPGQTVPLAAGSWPVSVSDGSGCVFDTVIIMPTSQDLLVSLPTQLILSPGSNGQINLTVNVPASQISTVVWTPDTGLTATI